MLSRIIVVLLLLGAFALAPLAYRRHLRRLQDGPADHPPVPTDILDGAVRTWVLFTTPWCATCTPVEERLRAFDPEARVVKVDATVERDLAGAFQVRSAPTALLADHRGQVRARLVGVDAVDRYVLSPDPA